MDLKISTGLLSGEQSFVAFDPSRVYDIIIIGAGPAGLTAAVYAMRKGVSAGLIARKIGGQVAETAGIENYLGYRYIDGTELVDKFRDQVFQFGIAHEPDAHVTSIEDGTIKLLHLDNGQVLQAKTLLIASGKHWKKLNVPGEERLIGHGVAYCAICDAPFFADQDVVVAGGGNSGVASSIDLAKVARHVTLVQRRDHLTADQILIDRLGGYKNVDYLLSHEVVAVHGDEHVSGVTVVNKDTGKQRRLEASGLFVEIGLVPNSGFVHDLVETNEFGEIHVNEKNETSRPGIFAAGDVTNVPYKQIIVACGDGAKAALSATDYLLTENL